MKRIQLGVVAVLGILLLFLLNGAFTALWQEQRAEELSNEADLVQFRLEKTLAMRIDSTRTLESLFQLHPDTTAREFGQFSQNLMKAIPPIRALQFADANTQVVYVYPAENNEIAITKPMILLDDPLRGRYVKKAIEDRRMTIQPPFQLRQGGIGIIARNPIFISDTLIGLAIAVLDVPAIIEEALPVEESTILQFSLTDSEGNTFYQNLPEDSPFVERSVSFADTEWTLRIAYKNSNPAYPATDRLLVFGLGGLALCLLLVLHWYLSNRAEQLEMLVFRKTRELQDSERIFRIVSENSVDWGYWVAPDDALNYNSPSCVQITGYAVDDIKTNQEILALVHPDDRAMFSEHLLEEKSGKVSSIEFRIRTKSGQERWLGHKCRPVYEENGTFLGTRVSNSDITLQKLLQRNLQETVKEKVFLMNELNHRVKNNLMMINSLIRLRNQSQGKTADLSGVLHQIDAIRIVHEKLHEAAAAAHLDFNTYVGELLSTVLSFAGRHIHIEKTIEVGEISTNAIIPLGLIINEVATNAIKYGFTSQEPAVFTITMRKEGAVYVLTLSNTGNKFPEAVELDNPDTLGLRLIKALVLQLEGTVELQKRPCTVFTIRFPAEQ